MLKQELGLYRRLHGSQLYTSASSVFEKLRVWRSVVQVQVHVISPKRGYTNKKHIIIASERADLVVSRARFFAISISTGTALTNDNFKALRNSKYA